MHVAITGSRGLVGSALITALRSGGHGATQIVRGPPSVGQVSWDPEGGVLDPNHLEGMDAVVHLSGENIARRWNPTVKRRLRDSRIASTRLLADVLSSLASPPRTLICASAIGFYGDRGDEILTESSAVGSGFLAELVADWEQAARPAARAGLRVVNLRIGVILSRHGGALARMLLPFRLGGGGVVGSGRQYWSWIAIDDVVGAVEHALETESLDGPVNAVSPEPVTNREFTRTLGRVLRRPTIVPLPAFAARLVLGEMADELLLASARVVPESLAASRFAFRFPGLEDALRHVLDR